MTMHIHSPLAHVSPAATSGPAVPPFWCIDGDTRDSPIARRNVLAALWAGALLGLSGPALTSYAIEVHLADYQVSGDADVVEKITRDLNQNGLPIPAEVVREKLWEVYREALVQLAETD